MEKMQELEIKTLIDELEGADVKGEFIQKVEGFNTNYVEKCRKQGSFEKGVFPFGSVMPNGPLTSDRYNKSELPQTFIHRIIYVPYYTSSGKKPLIHQEEMGDLEYWRSKRIEYSRFLSNPKK